MSGLGISASMGLAGSSAAARGPAGRAALAEPEPAMGWCRPGPSRMAMWRRRRALRRQQEAGAPRRSGSPLSSELRFIPTDLHGLCCSLDAGGPPLSVWSRVAPSLRMSSGALSLPGSRGGSRHRVSFQLFGRDCWSLGRAHPRCRSRQLRPISPLWPGGWRPHRLPRRFVCCRGRSAWTISSAGCSSRF